MKIKALILATLVAVTITGCATDDPHRRAKTGAAIGAIVGAVIGHQMDDDTGKFVGAAIGALAGGAAGHYMDQQQRDFEVAFEEEQRNHEIEIERLKDDTLKLSVSSEVSFDFDSAAIKPAFESRLAKLGDVLNKYNRTIVHIVGHTDSVGSASYNRDLSYRRADSVVSYLIDSAGVPSDRLRTEGRGEAEPRDTNETEAGRQLNRRVEIYVKPLVEGNEREAYRSPRYL